MKPFLSRFKSEPSYEALRVAVDAACSGADVLLSWLGKTTTREKATRDYVTQADVASQTEIQRIISAAFPDDLFIGEESEPANLTGKTTCWLVDPLDGTTNFIHRMFPFAVSVALVSNGRPVVGVIVEPLSRDCYLSIQGCGAWCNDRPIEVSGTESLRDALLVGSLPPNVQPASPALKQFLAILYQARSLRRIGSCAMNFSFMAEGKLDGYWASSVQPWDVAAGALIVQEAGGVVRAIDGGEFNVFDPNFIAASSAALWQEMQQVIVGAA